MYAYVYTVILVINALLILINANFVHVAKIKQQKVLKKFFFHNQAIAASTAS